MSRHRKIHNILEMTSELRALVENPKVGNEPHHFLQQTTRFFCDLCDTGSKEFQSLEDLNKHRRSAHNVMSCDLCMKYYGRTSHLWKHVNKIHKGNPEITCNICQRTSASRLHLANHMLKHHRNETPVVVKDSITKENGSAHNCEKCSKIFRKESLMKKHVRHCKGPRQSVLPKPKNGIYTCEKCNKKFTVQNTLYKHMRNSHINYSCELCDCIVDSKTELYKHICENHSMHPDVKCDYEGCDKVLRCKADLERHTKDHRQSLQLHVCKFCAELMSSRLKMRKHLKTAHPKECKFLCALCLKAAINVRDLRLHIEECHSLALSRPYTCQVCAKPCGHKSKLLEHIKCHGSSFHPCKICFKIFPSKDELNDHVTNHPSDSGDEEDQDQMEEVEELDPNSIMDIIGAPKNEILEIHRSDDEDSKRKFEDDDSVESLKRMKLEFKCVTCEAAFSKSIELMEHKEVCQKLLKCSKCDKSSFDTNKDTEICVCNKSNNEEVVKCNSILQTALLTLKKDDDEINHLETPNTSINEKFGRGKNNRKVYDDDFTPSKCDSCQKVWPAKRHLWQHLIRFHKNEAGTTCGVCLKMCPDYKSLSAHLSIEHTFNFEGDGTNLSCRVCGKYHNARSKLQNHITIHPGQEDRALSNIHQCLYCNLTFASFPVLSDHCIKNHNILETSKEFDSKVIKIGEELKVEGEELPIDKKDVKKLKSIRVGAKRKLPFHTCDVCSLVFASEVGLTNHRRMHDHSDNFKCGQCGEVLSSAIALKEHKLSKHKGSEFVCADCKSNFGSYQSLVEHNKKCRMKIKNSSIIKQEGESSKRSSNEEGDEDSGLVLNGEGRANDDDDDVDNLSPSSLYLSECGDDIGEEDQETNKTDEDEIDSDEGLSETPKQNGFAEKTTDRREEERDLGDEDFEELVEVVEVDIDACPSPTKSEN